MNAMKIVLVDACQLINLIKSGDTEKKKHTKNTNSTLVEISLAIIKDAKIPKTPSEMAANNIVISVDMPKT